MKRYDWPTEMEDPVWYGHLVKALTQKIQELIARGEIPASTMYVPGRSFSLGCVSHFGVLHLSIDWKGLSWWLIAEDAPDDAPEREYSFSLWEFINMPIAMDAEEGLVTLEGEEERVYPAFWSDKPESLYKGMCFLTTLQAFLREQPAPERPKEK